MGMNRLLGPCHIVALYRSFKELNLNLSCAVGSRIGRFVDAVNTVHLQLSRQCVICLNHLKK